VAAVVEAKRSLASSWENPMTDPTPEFVSNNNFVSSAETVLPSRINRFLEDFQAGIQLHAARVAAGHAPFGELEEQFHAILEAAREASPERFEGVRQRMARPLQLQRIDRRYSAFANVEVDQPGALDEIDVAERHRAHVAPFATNWVYIPPVVDGLLDAAAVRDRLIPQAGFTGLKFFLQKVKCVEETSGWGSDEIYMSANFVDETGDTSYHWWRVSDDFDTGEIKNYGFPGKELQYFNISEGGSKFPKFYTAFLSMVEEDWGHMSEWFKDLYGKIKTALQEKLKQLGYKLGQAIGLGEIGQLIGTVFGKLVDWLLDWIVQMFKNDYMGTFSSTVRLNNYTGSWAAVNDPYFNWSRKFVKHGGHYHVWYGWQLVK
jgi:hypothetical protein